MAVSVPFISGLLNRCSADVGFDSRVKEMDIWEIWASPGISLYGSSSSGEGDSKENLLQKCHGNGLVSIVQSKGILALDWAHADLGFLTRLICIGKEECACLRQGLLVRGIGGVARDTRSFKIG